MNLAAMAKGLKALAAGALLLSASLPVVGQGTSSIMGSPHDFSTRGWGSDQICVFCHTPHNAVMNVAAPLWGHAVTTQTYSLYSNASSSTLNATTGQPQGVSKLCLSCHDGTVAIDSFGTRTGSNLIATSSTRNLGIDLRNDHPISFTYDAALVTADAGAGPNQLVLPASTREVVPGVPLFDGRLECASCHNPHNNSNGGFLRLSNAASALCLRCHIK